MTLEEMIALEKRAVDLVIAPSKKARRQTLYARMRAFSESVRPGAFPNNVSPSDAWLAVRLRAEDLARVSTPEQHFIPLVKMRRAAERARKKRLALKEQAQ